MKKRERPKLLRWLLYLTLVTCVISSATMAKYASSADGYAEAVVAAFVSDTTLNLDVPLEGMLPGSEKEMTFVVTNYSGDQINNVLLGYEVQVETTGNLPLEFSLTGEKKNADGSADADVANSVLAGALNEKLLAAGGRLPPAGEFGKKEHTYKLAVRWPESQADADYSDEIDQVTIKITTTQLNA